MNSLRLILSCAGVAILGCFVGHVGCCAGEPFHRKSPPNIVLILADDLGYRELGCFGQKKIQTPNLDRLAARGMKLTQHYSGNAVCAPSRCVLMTGRHPGHAWIRNNSEVQPEGQRPIPDSEITMAEMLKQQGYVTGAFGKWGLGGPGSEGDPMNQGFDCFFGYNCQRHAHSYYPNYLWNNRERVPLSNTPPVPGHARLPKNADPADPSSYTAFQGQEYAPDRIRDQALEFIRENRERPFFLYFPSTLPHVALHVPQESVQFYQQLGWQDPPFTAERGGYTPHFTPRAAYAAMITRLDSDVGAILQSLDKHALTADTLIIFSADNGTTHLQEEVDTAFFESVGELRGLKGSLYEGGLRVPTIVSFPGLIPAGTESDFVSGFEDWFPTLAEIAASRETQNHPVDGISLLKSLRGETQMARDYLYREFPGYGGQQSIRRGDWKLIRQNMTRGLKPPELFDLKNDPGETVDLSGKQPDRVRELTELMTVVRTPSRLFPLQPLDTESIP